MARRTRRVDDYEGPGGGRAPRRRSGNEGIWIALGAAVVLGIIFIFIVSGGSGGEADKLEATQAFEGFLKALLEDKYKNTLGRLSLEGMLREHNPGALKNRDEWTPEKRKEIELDLYRHLRHRVEKDLRLEGTIDIRRKVLDGAEVTWDDFRDVVKIRWDTEPYDTVIAERRLRVEAAPWVANLAEIDGKWLVTLFVPE